MKKSVSTPLIIVICVLAVGGIAWYAFKTMGQASGGVDQSNVTQGAQEIQKQDSGGPTVPPELLEKAKGMGGAQQGQQIPGSTKTMPGR